MTWHVLHAGKFVDENGIVLERAEHEFIAQSEGFPDNLRRAIARQEPPRVTPVQWAEGFFAGFTQTTMAVDGTDYTLRVIDLRAFEGSADRPGRAYRRRTYHIQPCIEWQEGDSVLPIDCMQTVPEFQHFGTVANWVPGAGKPATKLLPGDLGGLFGGNLRIGEQPSAAIANRLSVTLACLPPQVACRMGISIGGSAVMSVGDGSSTTPAPEVGQPWLDVLHDRGASTSLKSLAACAAAIFAGDASVDFTRPYPQIRAALNWALGMQSWALATRQAVAKNQDVPPCPVDPGPQALQSILPVLRELTAIPYLGDLAAGKWQAAWAKISEKDEWNSIAKLLSNQELSDDDLCVLANLGLRGEVALKAKQAASQNLPRYPKLPGVMIASRRSWVTEFRQENRAALIARCLQLTREPDEHPVWQTKEGKALQAIISGNPANANNLVDVPATWIAENGDGPANCRWLVATKRVGDPGKRNDSIAACLQMLGNRPITAPGLSKGWPTFQAPLPVAKALSLGARYSEVEACLPNVILNPVEATVQALLTADGFRPGPWVELAGRDGPWQLLADRAGQAPSAANRAILAAIPANKIPAAAANYAGEPPAEWARVKASDVMTWLDAGGPPQNLAAMGEIAPQAALAGLEAWSRKAQSPNSHTQTVVELLRTKLSWTERLGVRKIAKQLETQ